MNPFAILGTATLFGLAISWLAGNLVAGSGSDRVVLRLGLSLIVLAGAGVVGWFLLQKKKAAATPSSPKPVSGGQLDLILREAEAKLASAQLGPGTRINNLPVYLVIGPEGSAKTTAVVQSGVEPELLAGEVYGDGGIVATPFSNLWFAKQSVFVEAGDQLLSDSSAWARLVRHLAPGKLKSAMNRKIQAPRAAVVCFDSEALVRHPLEGNLAVARALRGRLSELASSLGISIPVYVLFTKADRIPFFPEYVANLDSAEAAQVFGTTIPLASGEGGSYGEVQNRRLKAVYQQLFYSLAGKRPDYLARERTLENTPAIYEFPREFRKLRATVVPFLVELCRPSQLTIGPFLRGFYFCGVRPLTVQEVAAAPLAQPVTRKAFHPESEATGMFRPQDLKAAPSRPDLVGSHAGVRRVPEWVFLASFFHDVLLADAAALGTSGSSARTNTVRRWLLASTAAVCLLASIAFSVSFAKNRSLESTAIGAAEGIRSLDGSGGVLPSVDSLNRLETLRQSLEKMAKYDREGPPLSLRLGLFAGDGLYPSVRKLYFGSFQQLLLLPVQKIWLASLRSLPRGPTPSDDYQRTYDTLKGYLITTTDPEKSTPQFLPPLLEASWSEGRSPGSERVGLARKQFNFYSRELKLDNPFSSEADPDAVKQGRAYLTNFAAPDRVYNFMLTEANQAEKPINFNADVKLSAEEVINNKDVPGAYTKGGWVKMQNAIKNKNSYFNGEGWVLGDEPKETALDRTSLEQDLRRRYLKNFIAQWRDFLNRSSIVPYKDVKDAAAKLSATSGSQSPLLALFHMASQNTAVESPDVQAAFKALYAVNPVSCADYVCPTNSDYMKELASLQVSLEEIVGPPNEASVAKTMGLVASATLKTRQMAQSFGIGIEGHLDRKILQLLEQPITNVPPVLVPKFDSRPLCDEMRSLSGKYPFNPKSSIQATILDVNAMFQPKEGSLWKFYDSNLQKLLVQQGTQYVAVTGSPVQMPQRFVAFFNRAADFSRALYSDAASGPNLTFKIKPVRLEELESVTLQINGQTLTYDGSGEKSTTFSWPGSSREIKATTKPPYRWFDHSELWAVYDFFAGADRVQPTSKSTSRLEYHVDACIGKNCRSQPGYRPSSVVFDLDMGPNPPIFQKGYLSSLSCAADSAK